MSDRAKFFLALFLILIGIGVSVWQFSILNAHKVTAESLEAEAANLRVIKEHNIKDYQTLKTEVASDRSGLEQEIDRVFPTQENITDLTRLLDDFATKNNFVSNPFFVSNLTYKEFEELPEVSYRILPFSLNLTTSKANLIEFLEFVNDSGALKSGVRLMSVEDLNIIYPEEFGGTYEVQLNLNAYFSREI